MFKKILIGSLFYFCSFGVQAQEVNPTLILSTMMVTTPVHCAPTDKAEKVFKKKDLAFTGLIDKHNVFKIYIKEEGLWTSMLQNSGGLSCIYFSGMPGLLTKTGAEKLEKSILKKEVTWSK